MIDFKLLKKKNQAVEVFSKKHLTEKSHKSLCGCWDWTSLNADKELKKMRVHEAPTCKKRVCAICTSLKSLKEAVKLSVVMDWISDVHEKEYIFMTFSAKNVTGGELPFEFMNFNKAIARFRKLKEVLAINCGMARKFEVTYSDEETITRDMWKGTGRYKKPMADYFKRRGLKVGDPNPNFDTYNLHVHAIIAVDKHYFTSRQYISQKKWLELWQRSMRDPSITHFHVQRLKKSPGEGRKEVHEIAKYAVKVGDLARNQDVFDVMYVSTYKKRLITFNGLFKDGISKYKEYLEYKKADKPHEFDKYVTPDMTEYFYRMTYHWNGNEYDEPQKRELTPEEIARISRIAFTEDYELED